jgi:hypothetical protein
MLRTTSAPVAASAAPSHPAVEEVPETRGGQRDPHLLERAVRRDPARDAGRVERGDEVEDAGDEGTPRFRRA